MRKVAITVTHTDSHEKGGHYSYTDRPSRERWPLQLHRWTLMRKVATTVTQMDSHEKGGHYSYTDGLS